MIETAITAVSWLLLAAGAFFYVVGGVGLVRMPDVFTRMHAAGISDTVGAGLMLVGMMLAAGVSLVTVKLMIILAVILFTSPVATHALAQAAMHDDVEPILATKTVLEADGDKEEPSTGGSEQAEKGGAPSKP